MYIKNSSVSIDRSLKIMYINDIYEPLAIFLRLLTEPLYYCKETIMSLDYSYFVGLVEMFTSIVG